LPLSQALLSIKGWSGSGPVALGPKIKNALELDDYANQSYSNGEATVSLFIGYYLTTKKVGAAHSPLVCFPGQGWVVSGKEEKSIAVSGRDIHFTLMTVERGQEKDLILYWFQAYDKTAPGTFLQKVYTLLAKWLHSREDNAFVRVSVPVRDQGLNEALATAEAFIKAFYPVFLEYVRQGNGSR
jgi:EpsI family protein